MEGPQVFVSMDSWSWSAILHIHAFSRRLWNELDDRKENLQYEWT